MKYLTVADVLGLHDAAIEDFGGSPNIRDIGLIESAVEQARQTFGGELLYTQASEVAASYWHSLTCNHGLIDGNKRTGAMAAIMFLERNGYELTLSVEMVAKVGIAMSSGMLDRSGVFALMARSVRRRTGRKP